MQFISYDSDSSENSHRLLDIGKKVDTVSSIHTANLPKAWTVQTSSGESSEDESEDQDKEAMELLQKDNKSTLLDAEALFASTNSKPKFLRRNIEDKFEVATVKVHTYDNVDSSAAQKFSKKNEPVKNTTRAVPMASLTSKLPIAKSGEPISESDLALKKKLDDRESAKDRVKRQRLSGQSGVGSDFKEWRSEEEMRQRQMYD